MDLLADVLEMIRNENCPAAPSSVNYFLCPLVGVLQAGQWARNSDPTATATIDHSPLWNKQSLLFFHHPSKKLSCQYQALRTMKDLLHHKIYHHFVYHIDDTYDGDNDDEEKENEGDTQSRGDV